MKRLILKNCSRIQEIAGPLGIWIFFIMIPHVIKKYVIIIV